MIRRLVIIKIGISAFKIAENRKQKTKILLIFKNDLIIVNCNSVISSWINKIYWLKLEDAEWSTTELFTNQNGLSLQYVCYALLRITIYWNGHLHSFHTHTDSHTMNDTRDEHNPCTNCNFAQAMFNGKQPMTNEERVCKLLFSTTTAI